MAGNVFDVYAMALFGVLGYALIKLDFELAPLLLGFVLGPMLEENLRRAMVISRGNATVFVTHPLSLALLVVAAGLLILVLMPNIRAKRDEAFQNKGSGASTGVQSPLKVERRGS